MTRYLLAYEIRDERQRWALRSFDGLPIIGDGEPLAATATIPADAVGAAQSWAIWTLYGHEVRAVGWEHIPGVGHVAITAPAAGAWDVTLYRGRGNAHWRAGSNGTWMGPGDARYRSLNELEQAQGPLTPLQVHNLPALVAELAVFRAVAGYLEGPDMCVGEYECVEYIEAEQRGERLERCSHVTARIARAEDTLALHRVQQVLDNSARTDHYGSASELAADLYDAIKGEQ